VIQLFNSSLKIYLMVTVSGNVHGNIIHNKING